MAKNCGAVFDNLLYVQRSSENQQLFDTGDGSQRQDRSMAVTNPSFPLSYKGIACLLSASIYDRFVIGQVQGSECINIYSIMLQPTWIIRECAGILASLFANANHTASIDKGLLAFLFLSDQVHTKVTLDMLEKMIPGPVGDEWEMPALKGFQLVAMAAPLSPDQDIRFLIYKLIDRFLDLCSDDARLLVLLELIDRCPMPTMKASAIGLLKDQVDKAFKASGDEPSCFSSRIVVDKFFPILYRVEKKWSEKDEHFWDDFTFIMQAANFYLYLLIRDRSNQTHVRDTEQSDWMQEKYVAPLKGFISRLREKYEKENALTKEESLDIKIMQLNMLTLVIDRISQEISKN
ncbi:uncharacterized protein BYT42DRAFT_200079 [Radiomyces spectabilis]|uniref:uncharacterized protein n=1 Tax=Radiomyces spectabilis TaxID=64574 RepID=UPI00221FD03F|nr:uncharacterized protein BYT42DRAFT_200079 [Radiomyces spectabilis]KAI8391570.1 hypothetical protein BYT42DRAFT_200079 [Radiomyces spectabilis]